MAREEVIWCDPCKANDIEQRGVERTIALDGADAVTPALCETHQKEFITPIEELLTELGLVKAAKKQPSTPAAGRKPRSRGSKRETCQVCGNTLKNHSTLQTHIRATHKLSWMEYKVGYAAELGLTADELRKEIGQNKRLDNHTRLQLLTRLDALGSPDEPQPDDERSGAVPLLRQPAPSRTAKSTTTIWKPEPEIPDHIAPEFRCGFDDCKVYYDPAQVTRPKQRLSMHRRTHGLKK